MNSGYQNFFKKASEAKRPGKIPAKPAFKINMKKASTPLAEAQEEERLRRAVRFTSRRRKPAFPWKAFAGLAVTIAGVGTYLAAPDLVEDLASRIEVNAVGSAIAAEGKPAGKSKVSGGGSMTANPDHGPDVKSAVPEDLGHFEKLKERKDELDMREKELAELEEELQKQKLELDKRIMQLESMRNQIAQILKDRVEVDQQKVNKLVDLYSNMKPKQAAEVIGSINEDLAVEVLAKMKKKSAAEIMNLLSPEKARTLSEKYTGYRRQLSEPNG